MSPVVARRRRGSRRARVFELPTFELESGTTLERVRLAYHLDGVLNPRRDNLVLILHALTGNSDPVGEWWPEVIGPGRPIDTRRWAVLAPNHLGSCYGSTGPDPGGGTAFPPITTRDLARFAAIAVRGVGAARVALVVGGSLGGMVALEWAATFPVAADEVVVLAAPAAHSAAALGWNHIMRRAVELDGGAGLELRPDGGDDALPHRGGTAHPVRAGSR